VDNPIRKKIKDALAGVPADISDLVKARRVKTEMLHLMGTAVQLFDRNAAVQKLIGDATVSVKGSECTTAFGVAEGKRKAVALVVGVDDQGPTYRVTGKKSCATRTQETAFAALATELSDYFR
jgi:hypothetical protein